VASLRPGCGDAFQRRLDTGGNSSVPALWIATVEREDADVCVGPTGIDGHHVRDAPEEGLEAPRHLKGRAGAHRGGSLRAAPDEQERTLEVFRRLHQMCEHPGIDQRPARLIAHDVRRGPVRVEVELAHE